MPAVQETIDQVRQIDVDQYKYGFETTIEVDKAPMAPAVPVKSNARQTNATRPLTNEMPPEVATAIRALAEAQAMALKSSKWVGGEFAEQSRAMHYGEREHATIHGQATPDEARALADEGVPIAPLPFPVAPPDELN